MSFKIYTKTGDKGLTGLIGGTRVSKADLRIDAYGTVDELNSWLGFLRDSLGMPSILDQLITIQNTLFVIGSMLATDHSKKTSTPLPILTADESKKLENAIDEMEKTLPALKNFVLPGGHKIASSCHIARCVCRRAERICVSLQNHEVEVDSQILLYLNRLSDYLFVLSRFILHSEKGTETLWDG
ncbi:MAG: cob(I)yrinic acid a,c-diamide adenosyltransferase [Chitinophagaceae bacterium]